MKPEEEEAEKSALEKLREDSPLTEMEDEDQHRTPSVAPSALTELDDQHEHHDVHEENIEENGEEHPEETCTPSPRKHRKRKSWTTMFMKSKQVPKPPRPMRFSQTRASRAAALEKHTALDEVFWETFDPVADRLPPNYVGF